MYYADLKDIDSINGVGVGVSLFVSGCRNACEGCFNPEAWAFDYGQEFTEETMNKILELIDREYIKFFSVLGGDPFEVENRECVLNIVKNVRERKPSITINIWSGYYIEDLEKEDSALEILKVCDILVDGPFEMKNRDFHLPMRGSSNQRIINLKEYFENKDNN